MQGFGEGKRIITKDGYAGVITGLHDVEEADGEEVSVWVVKFDSGLTQNVPEDMMDLDRDLPGLPDGENPDHGQIFETNISLIIAEVRTRSDEFVPSEGLAKWFRDELGHTWVKFRAVADPSRGAVTHVIPQHCVRAVIYEMKQEDPPRDPGLPES